MSKPESSTIETYAIFQRGAFQYFAEIGTVVEQPYLEGEVGDTITFDEILLVSHEGDIKIGTPQVDKAKVQVEILEQTKTPKQYGFKYKAKSRYRRKYGYRQKLTKVLVTKIEADGVKETYTKKDTKPSESKTTKNAKDVKQEEKDTISSKEKSTSKTKKGGENNKKVESKAKKTSKVTT